MADTAAVYLPVDGNDGRAHFTKWEDGVKMSEALNTVRSAKDFFFPQTENLVDFKVEGKTIEVIDTREECEDFVIFGVRACDAASFEILDRVYLHADPVDTYYKNRREHGTIVTLACSKPAETCFCTTFGIDPTEPAGDVTAWLTDDALYLKANTEKGTALLDSLALSDAECNCEVEEQKKATKEVLSKLPLANLTTEAFEGERMMDYFKSPEWASLSESCLGCGTCTFVCPTCQCYDIREFDTGHGIQRLRCWDSCMYSDFTKMAHGNSRNSQLERFRQRFMHKLVYQPMNNGGTFGCVGCGRCLAKCPINMNIVKVIKEIGGEK
jgi:ferredoxin